MCPLAGGARACVCVCDRWMPPSSCSGYALTHTASGTSLRAVKTPWLIDMRRSHGVYAAAGTLVTSIQRSSQIQTCVLRKLVCLAWHLLGSYNGVIAGLEVSGGPSGGVPIPHLLARWRAGIINSKHINYSLRAGSGLIITAAAFTPPPRLKVPRFLTPMFKSLQALGKANLPFVG